MAPSPVSGDRKAVGLRFAGKTGGGVDFFVSTKKNLHGVKNYQPGKPLEEVEREFGLTNAIKMASNENALGPSPKALIAIRKTLPKVHRYPDGGCFYLRNKLAKRLKVSTESLVFGNGSDELLVFAVRAFVGRGDEVIIADPTFLIYEIATQTEDGTLVKVPMKDFHYDLDGMMKQINAKTKIIFIANPDNPVGTYIGSTDLFRFLKAVPENIVVVLDEAYYEFAAAKSDYPDSIKLLGTFKNLIVTRTFSKAYGLSGLRIGFAVTSPNIAYALNKVREPFNVNLLAQTAAVAALDDTAHLRKTLAMVKAGRKYLSAELKKMGAHVIETSTNFILADLGQDTSRIYDQLLRSGVIVRPMGVWGLKNFIRVTIGKPAENKRFISSLKAIL